MSGGPSPLQRRLATAAFVLHGPLDIILTTVGRRYCPGDPEANPVVHELSTFEWLGVKGLALGGLLVAPTIAGASTAVTGMLAFLVIIGLLLVVPNAAVIATCR